MIQKRALFRIAIARAGHVQRGADTIPCHVMNITDKGVGLRVEGAFAPGDSLQLEFFLSEGDLIACTLQVTYVEPHSVGAAITHISAEHQTKLSPFIDDVNTLNMMGF
jgi:hypothetical protein